MLFEKILEILKFLYSLKKDFRKFLFSEVSALQSVTFCLNLTLFLGGLYGFLQSFTLTISLGLKHTLLKPCHLMVYWVMNSSLFIIENARQRGVPQKCVFGRELFFFAVLLYLWPHFLRNICGVFIIGRVADLQPISWRKTDHSRRCPLAILILKNNDISIRS